MKKLSTIFVAVLLTASLFAQSPEKISYQTIIRNSSGALVKNTVVGMEINLRKVSPTGAVVYTETRTPSTNENGLVSIQIGAHEGCSGDGCSGFDTIKWGDDTYFIETKVAVTAPLTTYTITSTSQLLSVPYALHAKTASSAKETDPVFNASAAAGLNSEMVQNLSKVFVPKSIGDEYGGGIVFFTWDNGHHGLIAAKTDVDSIRWAASNTKTGTVNYGLGGGYINSLLIYANQASVDGNPFAASVCMNYSGASLGDWYLPNSVELNLLYSQKDVVGGFSPVKYWSSNENSDNTAWVKSFWNGSELSELKSASYKIRPIRKF